MKKIVVTLAVFLGFVLLLLFTCRLTGILQIYNAATRANEPNIKVGEQFFVSNLKQPLRTQFLVFKNTYFDSAQALYNPDYKTGETYFYRICGTPGDVLVMKDGVLFVNNKLFDDGLNLKKQYNISTENYYSIDEADRINDSEFETMQNGENTIVTLEDVVFKKYQSKFSITPYLISDTSLMAGCFKWLSKSSTWSADNFGPIKIPADNYFVLGDNRHFAQDSRYIGFVKKEAIKGIVLGK